MNNKNNILWDISTLLYDSAGNYRYKLLTIAHYSSFFGIIYIIDLTKNEKVDNIIE